MSELVFDQSPVVSVACAENAFGALTSLYTSKMPWNGFRVLSQSQDNSYTSFIQLYVGSNPYGPILVSDGSPDSCWDYFIPGEFPIGTSFSAEVYYNTTAANNCNIELIGLSEPDIDCTQMVSLGISAGTAGVACSAGVWTSLGALPSLPIKAMRFGLQNTSTGAGETAAISFGPSSSSLTSLFSALQFGNSGSSYGWVRHNFRINRSLSGNNLYANPTQTNNIHVYLYY